MADENALPAVEASKPPPQSTGRQDHDVAYETKSPAQQPGQPKPGPKRPDDELTLLVNGVKFQGWQEVRVTRGIELMPAHFALRLTERLPDNSSSVAILPGQRCQVMMGNDLVMTGYVDTYQSQVTAKGHTITVTGRSATQDLIDCQAGLTSGQEGKSSMTFSASTLFQLAKDLCAPFGITVSEPDGEGAPLVSVGDGIPQFTLPLGQSVYATLEPLARWFRMLLIDSPDGALILAKVGTTKAASGFTLPGTAIRAQVEFSKSNRYTIYLPVAQTTDSAYSATAALHVSSANYFTPIADPAAFAGQLRHDGKPRYRPTVIVSEQNVDGIKLAELRAKWQKARDYGRSQALTVEVALWRDQAGKLWTPNTLAPVDMPALKLSKLIWLISEVTYSRGAGGTISVVTLMPAEAFSLEPDLYAAYDPKIIQALNAALLERSFRDPTSPQFNPNHAAQTGGT